MRTNRRQRPVAAAISLAIAFALSATAQDIPDIEGHPDGEIFSRGALWIFVEGEGQKTRRRREFSWDAADWTIRWHPFASGNPFNGGNYGRATIGQPVDPLFLSGLTLPDTRRTFPASQEPSGWSAAEKKYRQEMLKAIETEWRRARTNFASTSRE